ncbi:MAG: hypothetical protein AAF387_04545 [Pseudomonadota bacterium]
MPEVLRDADQELEVSPGAEAYHPPRPSILINTVVWGEAFVQTMLDWMLPSILTDGNLGVLSEDSEFIFFAPAEDLRRIENSSSYERLQDFLIVRSQPIDDLLGRAEQWDIVNTCHRRAAHEAWEKRCPVIFATPDSLYGEGHFRRVTEILADGYRAVMLPGLRVAKESFLPEIAQRYPLENGGRAVANRDLVSSMLPHLHMISKTLFADSPTFSGFPSHVYWPHQSNGLIAMCGHMHPTCVYPCRQEERYYSTVDDDYVSAVVPEFEKVYVSTDSDDLLVIELSPEGRLVEPLTPRRFSTAALARWCEQYANTFHRKMLTKKVHLHSEPLDDSWAVPERRFEETLNDLDQRLARPWPELLAQDPKAALARLLGRVRMKVPPRTIAEAGLHRLVRITEFIRSSVTGSYRKFYDEYTLRLGVPDLFCTDWAAYRKLRELVIRFSNEVDGTIAIAPSRRTNPVRIIQLSSSHEQPLTTLKDDNFEEKVFSFVIVAEGLEVAKQPRSLVHSFSRCVEPGGILLLAASHLDPVGGFEKERQRLTSDFLITNLPDNFKLIECKYEGGVGSLCATSCMYAVFLWSRLIPGGRALHTLSFPLVLMFVALGNGLGALIDRIDRSNHFYLRSIAVAKREF